MQKHVTTTEDDALRAQVANLILVSLSDDPGFGEQKQFSKWQRDNREVLIGLFGGTGSNNLQRVVAWVRREALGLRREPLEILCLLSEGFHDDSLDPDIKDALAGIGILTFTDVLRRALVDARFSKSILKPAPRGGLLGLLECSM